MKRITFWVGCVVLCLALCSCSKESSKPVTGGASDVDSLGQMIQDVNKSKDKEKLKSLYYLEGMSKDELESIINEATKIIINPDIKSVKLTPYPANSIEAENETSKSAGGSTLIPTVKILGMLIIETSNQGAPLTFTRKYGEKEGRYFIAAYRKK